MAKIDMAAQIAKAAQDRERRDRMLREAVPEPEMKAESGTRDGRPKPADVVVAEPAASQPAEPETVPAPEPVAADAMEPVDDAPAPEPQVPKGRKKPQPSRQETVPITVHFPRTVRQQLRLVAAETDRQLQDVIAEGLNMVLKKHGKPAIAPRDPKR
jgi:hypothetical protein